MMKPSQLFYVSLKAVVMNDGKVLLMQQQNGRWEFPGGRIDPGEETVPFETVLHREMQEECGSNFQFSIGPIIRAWTAIYSDGVYGLILEHRCQYQGGDIAISDEHKEHAWVGREEWQQFPLAVEGANGLSVTLNKLWDKLDQS